MPQHNILKQPQYWYESLVVLGLAWGIIIPTTIVSFMHYLADISFTRNWKSYSIIYTVSTIVYFAVGLIYYSIYSGVYKLFPPMPYAATPSLEFVSVSVFYVFWLRYQ